MRDRPRAWMPLAALLGVAGVVHLLRPGLFRPLVPDVLGAPDPWVYGSGVAEIACAAGLVAPRTRRAAGWATALLLVAVFPGNVQMALDAVRSGRGLDAWTAVTLARLPLQVPLVWWAVLVARSAARQGRVSQDTASARGRR